MYQNNAMTRRSMPLLVAVVMLLGITAYSTGAEAQRRCEAIAELGKASCRAEVNPDDEEPAFVRLIGCSVPGSACPPLN